MKKDIIKIINLYNSSNNMEIFSQDLNNSAENNLIDINIFELSGLDALALSNQGNITKDEALEFCAIMYDWATFNMV